MSFQAYRSFIGVFSSVAKFATENASITKQVYYLFINNI